MPDEPELEADEPELEGDEPELEADEPEPKPATGAPPQAPRRGSARVQALANEVKELRAAKASFEQQLQALVAERRQPTQAEQAAAIEQERQHFELMTPYEQFQYSQAKIREETARNTNQIAQNLWEQNDLRDHAALLESNPAYRRYDDAVTELKQRAPGVARRFLLATAIGLKALEQGGAARTRAGKAAETAAERQNARPAGGRSDTPSDRGRTDGSAARDARLRAAGLIA